MPTEATQTIVLDRESLLTELKLDAADRQVFGDGIEDLLGAMAKVVPPERVEVEAVKSAASTSAHLLIAGKKYHLNVTESFKTILMGALTIVAKGMILDKSKLIEAGISSGAQGLITILGSLTRLTDRQQMAVGALCDIIREKKLPNYHPSTKEIAKRLKWKAGELEETLLPINGRVVELDAQTKAWRLIF